MPSKCCKRERESRKGVREKESETDKVISLQFWLRKKLAAKWLRANEVIAAKALA